ncbi:hypothetical protein [Bacillus cereus]|uniref:hypothetical protein n=1 Tax=Bacillus cereus TaxID=1396 RepID=UPI002AC0F6D6|nr:hypothetical protein [Bacillus cereus]MDZ4476837.1 hypothetical protein [Bacillus cereus]MDZ4493742.1 hypothetical protein [Bacillus cereus]MDZ4518535.1 hypothetical protein [Bacillus cereus]
MSDFLSIDEIMVDLRNSTKWDLKFIEDYQSYNKKVHEFEFINATFSYHPILRERAENEMDWDAFKKYIASDFNNLKYPPCHLYLGRNEVTANWFTPEELLVYGLGAEEIQVVMKNMEQQLKELNLCKLEGLVAVEADRKINEELYLEYYRKSQFIKVLLSRETNKSNIISKKEEA